MSAGHAWRRIRNPQELNRQAMERVDTQIQVDPSLRHINALRNDYMLAFFKRDEEVHKAKWDELNVALGEGDKTKGIEGLGLSKQRRIDYHAYLNTIIYEQREADAGQATTPSSGFAR